MQMDFLHVKLNLWLWWVHDIKKLFSFLSFSLKFYACWKIFKWFYFNNNFLFFIAGSTSNIVECDFNSRQGTSTSLSYIF